MKLLPMTKEATFSKAQTNALREAFSQFTTFPVSKHEELSTLLDGCSDTALVQLSEAGIRFVSMLAGNRVMVRATQAGAAAWGAGLPRVTIAHMPEVFPRNERNMMAWLAGWDAANIADYAQEMNDSVKSI